MKIRAYRESDWPRLCEIHDAARMCELSASNLTDAFLTLGQTAENEGLFDGAIVVAEAEGAVQGFAAFSDNELTWLYCHPALHRRGIGRALLKHVIAACGGTLSTEVLVGNEAALNLYLSEGFKLLRISNGKLAGNETFSASGYVMKRTSAV